MSETDFPVVGIGASAGGLEAFRKFFEHLPADPGMAFVLILHLPKDRKSMLTEIVSRWTSMPVIPAVAGTRIEPDNVYVPPPHSIVKLADGRFTIQEAEADRQFRPIDDFFDALGTDLRERAIGIVLSGTGSDGALGLKALKARGGLTIAQGTDGSAPQYGEMPAGAIATGVVDIVLPVEDMPGRLLRLRKQAAAHQPALEAQPDTEAARLEICTLLRSRLGHDFSDYRSQTFLRRVARRMQVTGAATLQDYVERLKAEPNELTLLFRDLLIRVTSFFRDSETFDVLGSTVIPRLFDGKSADGVVRVWIPGCATGEETYSFAILLREHMSTLPMPPRVQLFGTDIDSAAISIARTGRYPETLVEGLSEQRLRRFFTYSQGSYCVSKEIRELCTFSEHNVIRDPPFSMMNVVSCRNLLIYMNPSLQSRALPIFHYALVPNGFLLLGGSESVAQHSDLFDTLDKSARIFQKRNARTPDLALRWQRPPVAADERSLAPPGRWNIHGHHFDGKDGRRDDSARMPSGILADEVRLRQLLEPLEPTPEAVSRLQEALTNASIDLRSLTEEHQTAQEELHSTNEELHSVNEELQSTNEELETSKEELQSLNEELHTVNLRLSEKVDELDQANGDLRNLFDSTEIATVFLDRHLVIRSFTSAMGSLYNLIPSDQGRPLTDIVGKLRYTGLREDVNHVLSSLEALERRVQTRDQKTHYIMRIVPYREPDSTVTGVLVTFTDVSSIVQAEEALMAADVRKDVFLATLSHELRNPLAPIRSAAQLLQLSDLPAGEVKAAQSIIARQVAHMSSLLDDLLDVSRITRSVFLLKKEYVSLGSLMDAAVEAVQPAMDIKQHTLRVERPAEPITLDVDPVRMTQVITNLLTNAAKYTAPGGLISLGTRIEPLHIVVYVRDNGIGLTDDAMTRVFDMFSRVGDPDDRQEGGLGIGLALARGLMELHGGSLQVHSAGLKQGSEFVMCIPRNLVVANPAQQTESDIYAGTSVKPRRILVADDNVDNAAIMEMLLRSTGHEVRIANNGTDAWEIARAMRPDVCIFDIGMPGLTGNELAERIRHEAWGDKVLLIAVTGWGQSSDRRKAIASGFDHHLTKPVDPSVLENLIDRWDGAAS